jgi:putative endonuclease
MTNNVALGKNGEEIAQKYLIKKGYKIIETNKHFSKFCEIDIIALDKNTLVFIEVKTRKTDICGHPFEAVTKTKYQHIKQGLFTYLKEHPEYKKYRIDAVSIILKPEIKIEYLKNI